MTWKDLVQSQIASLEKDREKEIKKMNKIRDNDSSVYFAKKVEISANIKSITESIGVLYILLGMEREVTEWEMNMKELIIERKL